MVDLCVHAWVVGWLLIVVQNVNGRIGQHTKVNVLRKQLGFGVVLLVVATR